MEFMIFHVNCGTQLEYNIRFGADIVTINSANHTNTMHDRRNRIIFKSILKILGSRTNIITYKLPFAFYVFMSLSIQSTSLLYPIFTFFSQFFFFFSSMQFEPEYTMLDHATHSYTLNMRCVHFFFFWINKCTNTNTIRFWELEWTKNAHTLNFSEKKKICIIPASSEEIVDAWCAHKCNNERTREFFIFSCFNDTTSKQRAQHIYSFTSSRVLLRDCEWTKRRKKNENRRDIQKTKNFTLILEANEWETTEN